MNGSVSLQGFRGAGPKGRSDVRVTPSDRRIIVGAPDNCGPNPRYTVIGVAHSPLWTDIFSGGDLAGFADYTGDRDNVKFVVGSKGTIWMLLRTQLTDADRIGRSQEVWNDKVSDHANALVNARRSDDEARPLAFKSAADELNIALYRHEGGGVLVNSSLITRRRRRGCLAQYPNSTLMNRGSSALGVGLGLGHEADGVLLHQAVQGGLLGLVALAVDRRAIRRQVNLPTDGLHAFLPRFDLGRSQAPRGIAIALSGDCLLVASGARTAGEIPGSCRRPATGTGRQHCPAHLSRVPAFAALLALKAPGRMTAMWRRIQLVEATH